MQSELVKYAGEFITSGIFIGFVLTARFLLTRMIRRNAEILTKDQRRWITRTKNGAILIVLIGLVMIWSSQIQNFALSLTAFAVAFVIATKEMIMCFLGSLFRLSTNPYKVGDWVTIDGRTGEVMDIDAFTTRLEEIDTTDNSYQFTGKSLIIPNSRLFTANIDNQNFMKGFIAHTIPIAVQYTDIDPSILLQKLDEIVQTHTASYKDDAAKFTRRVARKTGIDIPEIKPAFGLRTTDLGHFVVSARVFIPPRDINKITALVTQQFLSEMYKYRLKTANQKE